MVRGYLLIGMVLLFTSVSSTQDLPASSDASTPRLAGVAFAPDVRASQPSVEAVQPWQILDRIGAEAAAQAHITVALDPSAPAAAQSLAREIRSAWESGDRSGATRKLYDLGTMVGHSAFELTIDWKDLAPVSGNDLLAGNVRIGVMDSVKSVSLAANADASRLYAMLSHASQNGSMYLYQSTDKGATWTLKTTVTGAGVAPIMSIATAASYLYVGYLPVGNGKMLRIRRFDLSTGAAAQLSNGSNFVTAFAPAAGDTIRDVVASSNLASYNNRIYFAVRTHAKRAHFFWAVPTADSLWTEMATPTSVGVTGGLSMGYSVALPLHHVFLSYTDSLGRVCVDTSNGSGTAITRAVTYPHAVGSTSLSAYGDTVLCAYDYYAGSASHVRYVISYDAGKTWSFGTPIDTTATSETPAVMLEKGQGMVIFHRHYTASSREGHVVYRKYKGPGAWTTAVSITDYVPHYWRYGIAALGDSTWGVAYITFNFQLALQAVVFTTYKISSTVDVPTDQLTTPASYALFQNYPNPFNPSTEIAYDLPRASRVSLIVYDVLGKEVAKLVDAVQPAGQQIAQWNASGLSSGVYFYRLQAGEFAAVKKLVLMK